MSNNEKPAYERAKLVLEINHLTKKFAVDGGKFLTACNDINLRAYEGRTLGIIGESGCGKSVSMMSVMQLLADNAAVRADAILFDGMDLQKQSRKQMRKLLGSSIGMIFQDPMTSLNPLYTIGNQLMEPLRQHQKMTRAAAKARALEMLRLVGINEPASPTSYCRSCRSRIRR